MGLRLQSVTPRQGWLWFRDGLRLFARRPLALTLLFMASMLGIMVALSIPVVGAVLGFALFPLLTLGFMIASRSVLRDGPVHPGQLFDGFRGAPARRRALLLLCAIYAIGSVAILELSHWFDAGAFERFQVALGHGDPAHPELQAALDDPRLLPGLVLRATLATLISIPFWHAPALVHWGNQGVRQALFSSTLALWRAKGAFAVYSLAWGLAVAASGAVAALALDLLGLRALVGVIGLPLGLFFSTAFYASLWFTFADCFGGTDLLVETDAQP
jgi:hypothetical protein